MTDSSLEHWRSSFRNELKSGQRVRTASHGCPAVPAPPAHPRERAHIKRTVTPEVGYFLIIVLGLPLHLLLLTGPGMWSEKWGWRAMERLERFWNRIVRRKP